MIMAHNEPYILDKLIKMLDYPNNDIYIHIDAKSKLIDAKTLCTNYAHLVLVPSRNMTWGGVSQIYVILGLLEKALKTKHDYYHLISGVDLPLKNNSDMVDFFVKNKGKEFIGITPGWAESPTISERYKLHWLFQDNIGKKRNLIFFLSRIITNIEKIYGYKRERGEKIYFYGGPVWFSITEDAAIYIIKHGGWAKKRFRATICCDEIFAQTIIGNSEFAERIYNKGVKDSHSQCLRFVRFNKESPFVLEIKDLDDLVNSGCLFARKFATNSVNEIALVDKIYDLYR